MSSDTLLLNFSFADSSKARRILHRCNLCSCSGLNPVKLLVKGPGLYPGSHLTVINQIGQPRQPKEGSISLYMVNILPSSVLVVILPSAAEL